MARIYSYVVRYDSGFAPNPFYNYCTLATCKPGIRGKAQIGDWIVGCGSKDKSVRRGGYIVYAMRVTEVMNFEEYNFDNRFNAKKPYRYGSRKQSCGDNIYFKQQNEQGWSQRDSFHSKSDGSINHRHVDRDTSVNRVLISDDFVYFGGTGPKFPNELKDKDGRSICKKGRGIICFDDFKLIEQFESWISSSGYKGYEGAPYEWLKLRRK